MVLGLGGCFGGGAVADGRRVSPAAKQADGEGHGPEAKKPQRRVVREEKVKKGGEVVAAGKERKKRDHKKQDPPILMHQFPFHSRPGLL